MSAGTPWLAFTCAAPLPVQMTIVMPGVGPVACMTVDCTKAKLNIATARNAATWAERCRPRITMLWQ